MTAAVIVDSGGANLASLQFALARLGTQATVSRLAQEIRAAKHVLLPGVGSAPNAMMRLREAGLTEVLAHLEQPVLGICLGMQLLFERSDEGDAGCLGVVPGEVRRLRAERGRPVPHMGWNQLHRLREDPILAGIAPSDYVYFVHGYAAPVGPATVASVEYGGPLCAVVRERNFWGVQFHPERSGTVGARVLQNFLQLPA